MRLGITPKDPPCEAIIIDRWGRVIDIVQHITMRQAISQYPAGLVEVWDNGRCIWNGPRHELEGSV